MNGPGIFFSEVEARFRLSPSRVVVSRSSAVGPSMGISLDGYYDLAARQMDMQGVLSPIYIVNGIGRIFSRKGEGLIGFNFNLRGAVDAPRVAVNPLSVFTPGMFRDIFRRPPPELSQ
ncbi:AsmA-like C-terminal region-containing protein [Ponticoccus litoralis]|uniref:AsmA-like C-terminal region-containing protein n=1 Tax=Ponticoccus litoralis TaxID=422297 RepID=A0AAW9SIA8_9RHOB